MPPRTIPPWLRWFGAVLSGLLLFLAFPPADASDIAWGALVPLVLASLGAPPRRAFGLGFTAGALFWLASIVWITRVTWIGWVLLSLYCGLYVGGFAWFLAAWDRRWGGRGVLRGLALLLAGTVFWVGLEAVRFRFGTGFAWNALGVSQAENLPVIQIAAIGGVLLVSAVVAAMNLAVALTIRRYASAWMEGARARWAPHGELMVGFLAVALAFSLGVRRLARTGTPDTYLKATLIQPAVPQDVKWTLAFAEEVYDMLGSLTRTAIGSAEPDLVIWPETAIPEDLLYSERAFELVQDLAQEGVPLLIGSMDRARRGEEDWDFYNCSFLIRADGAIPRPYRKQHLVLFGETVPLGRQFPWLLRLTPIDYLFTPGPGPGFFDLEGHRAILSPLICFEDTVPWLARAAVTEGANVLVNQTNDAWFDPSWASRQHMRQAVFRAVETGTPMVRSANTGVSCLIDPYGRVLQELSDPTTGDVTVRGFLTVSIPLPALDRVPTVYVRKGYRFDGVMMVLAGLLGAGVGWPRGGRFRFRTSNIERPTSNIEIGVRKTSHVR